MKMTNNILNVAHLFLITFNILFQLNNNYSFSHHLDKGNVKISKPNSRDLNKC